MAIFQKKSNMMKRLENEGIIRKAHNHLSNAGERLQEAETELNIVNNALKQGLR